jgi:hypothetical protein
VKYTRVRLVEYAEELPAACGIVNHVKRIRFYDLLDDVTIEEQKYIC